jgi:WD40 repeat protein
MVRSAAFSPDGDRVFIANGFRVTAFDALTGGRIWQWRPPRVWVFLANAPGGVAVSHSGEVAMTAEDGLFGIWDVAGTRRILVRDEDAPRYFAFVADGSLIAGTDRGSLCVWRTSDLQKVARVQAPEGRIHAFAASPFGDVVATRSLESIALWDAELRSGQRQFPVGPGLPVLAFSPRAPILAFAQASGVVIVDFAGVEVARYDDSQRRPLSMAFSPTDNRLAVGYSDGAVRFLVVES